MKYSFISVPAFLAQLLGQVVGRRFPDERLAATRRAVEQKTLGRGVLKFGEKLAVNQRQFDRILDRLQRLILPAYLFPRQLWHVSR